MRMVDLRGLPASEWQQRLLASFAELADGEAIGIRTEADPVTVWPWLNDLQPGRFTWEYLSRGRGQWIVAVGLPFRSGSECVCRRTG